MKTETQNTDAREKSTPTAAKSPRDQVPERKDAPDKSKKHDPFYVPVVGRLLLVMLFIVVVFFLLSIIDKDAAEQSLEMFKLFIEAISPWEVWGDIKSPQLGSEAVKSPLQ
ncbi:MAG: hypothetical protein N4A61_01795 [Pelagimonas sp.]|jgi:hypothetical protein|nr:hypothetical protein [Pelagimonas sp.]